MNTSVTLDVSHEKTSVADDVADDTTSVAGDAADVTTPAPVPFRWAIARRCEAVRTLFSAGVAARHHFVQRRRGLADSEHIPSSHPVARQLYWRMCDPDKYIAHH